jgi:hypothetical protein
MRSPSPRHTSRFGARPALVALVAALLAGCSNAGPGSTSSATPPGGSGSASACPVAPDAGNLSGWQSPATAPAIIPQVIANPGELTCGDNRFLFSFFDARNNVLAKPDRKASVAIFDLGRDASKPIATVEGTFVWAIQDARGIYIAHVNFTEAGAYGAEFTTSAPGEPTTTIRSTFSVDQTSPTVRVGQKAPSTKTPTATDAGGNLAQISTDGAPDPAFYKVSEDAALARHDPMVVIFATPKFCQSAQCGPTLDRIKPFAAKYPSVDFIHVEPYELKLENGALQPVLDQSGGLVSNSITTAWGLTGEPWVFVVDRTGTITASLELIFSDAELTAALDAVK